jgi:hypothetical protein
MGDGVMGSGSTTALLRDWFVLVFPVNFYQKPIKYVTEIYFTNFWRKQNWKIFFGDGSCDLAKCGSWPPIILYPSFQ